MHLDYELLRLIWWLLLGILLVGFAIMDGFDLGVAMLLPFVAKNDIQRRIVINSIGPVWEGNQVWFILGGGAIFAAWPLLYAVSFSAFYSAMFLLLIAFILRPVGFKYRSKLPQTHWRQTWDYIIASTGLIIALVLGIAVGNVLQGIPFHFDQALRAYYTGSFWGLFNPFALLCGLTSVMMMMMHGSLYLGIKTVAPIKPRAVKISRLAAFMTLLLFAGGGVWVAYHVNGYVLNTPVPHDGPSNPLLKDVSVEVGAWVKNYTRYPLTKIAPTLGLMGALLTFLTARFSRVAFLFSSITIFGIITTVGLVMYPFILPSSSDYKSSLLLWDASSSPLTLKIMLLATLIFLPIILLYTSWVYYVLRGKVTEEDVKANRVNAY